MVPIDYNASWSLFTPKTAMLVTSAEREVEPSFTHTQTHTHRD